jgi:Zn-dependent peptidase ImmA (M78 family)
MTVRVHVEPSLLEWASERSGKSPDDLSRRVPRLAAWARGDAQPTLKQLEAFARATSTPVGLLMLSEPPDMPLPVPDFRTLPGAVAAPTSPDLLDTIYLCEERQEWYRSYALVNGADPLDFVGSVTAEDDVVSIADGMRLRLAFDLVSRREYSSWTEALGKLSERAEDIGVLVMISGVVGSNTHRALDPDEFRGFALVDDLAPVVFINGADTKAAQIFTLAHELVHIWLGQPAVSNPRLDVRREDQQVERFCNAVAAELLVPLAHLRDELDPSRPLADELDRLARLYRVSTLVVLRRIFDAGRLSWDEYDDAYSEQMSRVVRTSGSSGGNFYYTQPVRTSKRFAHAVIADTLEGRTLHRDAFRLLGVRQYNTFRELGHRLELP